MSRTQFEVPPRERPLRPALPFPPDKSQDLITPLRHDGGTSDGTFVRRSRQLASVIALAAAVSTGIALASSVPASPATAFCFILISAGISLTGLPVPGGKSWPRYATWLCGAVAALISLSTRTAPLTAAGFVLLGSALIFLDRRQRWCCWLAQLSALGAALLGLVALQGYTLGLRFLLAADYRLMPLPFAALFLALGMAIPLARADHGWMAIVASRYNGGALARRLLPVTLTAPIAIGWLLWQGQQAGWYGTHLGLALFATFTVLVLGFVTWRCALWLNAADVERSRAEAAMAKSEEQLRVATLAADIGVWSWTPGTADIVVSTGWRRLFAIPPGANATLGTWADALHPDDRERAVRELERAAEEHREFNTEYRVVWPDGTVRWLVDRGRAAYDDSGRAISMSGVNVDITRRKEAEQAVRQSEEKLRRFTEFAPVAIAMFDRDMRYIAASQRFRVDFGLGAQNLTGRSHYEIFPEIPQRWREIHQRCLAGAVERNPADPFVRSDGTLQWVRWEIQPWHQPDGSIGGVVMFTEEITPHKRAEEALRQSAEKLGLALHAAQMGAWDWDLLKGEFVWSERSKAVFALPADEQMSYEAFLARIHPEDRERIDAAVRRALDNNEEYSVEMRVPWPDGTMHWVASTGRAFFDDEGKPVRMTGMTWDVTERKQAEEALRESEERFRAAFDHAAIGVVLVSAEGRLVSVNNAICEMLGYTREELAGRHFQEITYPEDSAAGDEALRRMASGELARTSFEKRYVRKNGDIIWAQVLSAVLRGGTGSPVRFITQIQDVTERKRAETAARESKKQLQDIIDGSPGPVIVKDLEGRIITVNRRLEQILARPGHELKGTSHYDLFPRDLAREDRQHDLKVIASGSPEQREDTLTAENGREYVFLSNTFPLRDGHDRVYALCSISTDITQRKQDEERLRQTQKLESIGVLAGGVAHDFNNILTGIMGNASFLKDQVDPATAQTVQGILSGAERAAHLTRQLLAYSGKGQFQIKNLDLSGAVREMADLLRLSIAKTIELRMDLAERLPLVSMDPGQLQQLILNLVINAGEAIGVRENGSILLSTRVCDVEQGFVDALGEELTPGRYVCLQVADNGPGMDEATTARIFDPFFTTKFTGRGLGLAAVSGIMRSVKGAIALDTSPGKGATFRLYFRIAACGPEPEKPRVMESAEGTAEWSVLIVDDEPAVRSFLSLALQRKNYRIFVARDGREALARWDEVGGRIDLVILDVVMPVMGGSATLAELKRRRPELLVLLTSGFSEAEARRLCSGYGATAFLQKPYTAKTIQQEVENLLKQGRTR